MPNRFQVSPQSTSTRNTLDIRGAKWKARHHITSVVGENRLFDSISASLYTSMRHCVLELMFVAGNNMSKVETRHSGANNTFKTERTGVSKCEEPFDWLSAQMFIYRQEDGIQIEADV